MEEFHEDKTRLSELLPCSEALIFPKRRGGGSTTGFAEAKKEEEEEQQGHGNVERERVQKRHDMNYQSRERERGKGCSVWG